MSLGTLYYRLPSRSVLPIAIIKSLGLDVKIVEADSDETFAKSFPLKKVPAFIGSKGQKLHEVIAITRYLINLAGDEKAKKDLLGADIHEEAQVMKWESFANSDFCDAIVRRMKFETGAIPYNKKSSEEAAALIDTITSIYEERLKNYTYVATEKVTTADILSAMMFFLGFVTTLGSQWRSEHPIIMRWFNSVVDSKYLKGSMDHSRMVDEPLKYSPPKKEKKEKKEQPKKEQEKTVEDDIPAEPKKPKHPLSLLSAPTLNLDDWKRKYSNEDTRPVALPWFWEQYNPEDYSLWKVSYKYNEELTMTFMSNNLIGGFFNRLSASTKYMFGCLVVYGENNNNGIIGAMMVRGQDYVPAFDVAPDWESYEYTKLDPSNPEDKEFINNMWAWDKPVVVNGEPREIADGKVFK
ncbi:translation elongation factor EF1B gamma Ecym_3413 [Eremothecium cymbalariae DBVPG|uniref:Elongation factor 1-gamma 1 n=1 Tax=Eremothecium cymbalariae (strain CBS 270.75 / DBVPG 7215 / KCTC 17166 / NRRL Y-17582) TaxID=931890 RepID=G8JRY0_ERECY|nr:Hypothetical protein Ecym_3413 [Eremothecium cymbalariae DBVPG\